MLILREVLFQLFPIGKCLPCQIKILDFLIMFIIQSNLAIILLQMSFEPSFYLTQSQIIQLKSKLNQHNKIQQILKMFVYNQSQSHQKNMNIFCNILKNHLNLQNKQIFESFQQFISNDYNIPIQVNLQAIKYDQVLTLIDEWLSTVKQISIRQNSDKLYNIKFRNILFSRVFVEQKQNIQQYFSTLSQKNMLKSFDLYQLLVTMLSHYVLYQFSCDNESFFEKTNSFNNFIEIVQKFKHSQKRIIIDNKSKDFQYIKIYQFQALLSYWELINSQLQLRTERRFNKNQKQTQTVEDIIGSSSIQVQTQKQKQKLCLDQIINNTIRKLNCLTQTQNNPNRLIIIQSLCQCLRKQKILLLNQQQQERESVVSKQLSFNKNQDFQKSVYLTNSQKKSPLNQMTVHRQIKPYQNQLQIQGLSHKSQIINSPINSQQTQRMYANRQKSNKKQKKLYTYIKDDETSQKSKYGEASYYRTYKQKSQHNQGDRARIHQDQKILTCDSPQNRNSKLSINKKNKSQLQIEDKMQRAANQNVLKRLLTLIYNNYCKNQYLDIEKMNKFFIDIGIIQKQQTSLMLNLIKNNLVDDLQNIQKAQFQKIMNQIMKQDSDLTIQVIEQFVDLYIVHQGKIYIDKKIKQKQRRSSRFQESYERYDKRQQKKRYNYSPFKVQIPLLSLNKNKYRN